MAETIIISGLEEERKKLEQMMTSSPGMEKRLRGAIRRVLGEVRAKLRKEAQTGLQMDSDPRKAYKAVRYAVYRKIFGGQVNILNSQKTTKGAFYAPPRKLRPGQRGGNRRKMSDRTIDLASYEGASRAFVLRFLNAGTKVRYAGYGRNGRNEDEYNMYILHHNGMGNRGKIKPRNWFGPRSHQELEDAAVNIQAIIDAIINEEFV